MYVYDFILSPAIAPTPYFMTKFGGPFINIYLFGGGKGVEKKLKQIGLKRMANKIKSMVLKLTRRPHIALAPLLYARGILLFPAMGLC